MGSKLYVGNLSYDTDQQTLEQMFAEYGTVSSVELIMDRETGQSKGFGFVQMGSDSEAADAIEGMHERQVDGRNLTVNEARPKTDRPRGNGGGGGGYGGGGGGGGYGGGGGGGRRGGGGGGGYGGGGGGNRY